MSVVTYQSNSSHINFVARARMSRAHVPLSLISFSRKTFYANTADTA